MATPPIQRVRSDRKTFDPMQHQKKSASGPYACQAFQWAGLEQAALALRNCKPNSAAPSKEATDAAVAALRKQKEKEEMIPLQLNLNPGFVSDDDDDEPADAAVQAGGGGGGESDADADWEEMTVASADGLTSGPTVGTNATRLELSGDEDESTTPANKQTTTTKPFSSSSASASIAGAMQ